MRACRCTGSVLQVEHWRPGKHSLIDGSVPYRWQVDQADSSFRGDDRMFAQQLVG